MTNIKDILQKLCEYFDPGLTFDEIVEKDEQNELENLPIITNAMNHTELSNILLELCSEYRMCRQSDCIAVHVETWNEFSKFVNPEQFSVFFYALIANGKSNRYPKCKTIAMLAARCYCLCQTSPGSKAYGFFNEVIVEKCFGLLKMLGIRYELRIHCMNFLEDIEILLGIVTLDDYLDVKQTLIENVSAVLGLYYANSLQGAHMIDEKCLRVLENLIQPLQGDVEANLMLILNGTISLNKFHRLSSGKIDSIVNWFISLLDKYPNQTCLVLTTYIKHILTLPALSGDSADRLRNIDLCVQYDSAMYTKCNQSIIDYLKELATSTDVYDRESCVEMVGKMLLMDSLPASWSSSSDTIPREIDLFSMLVTKLLDSSNSIKVKAVNLFIKVTQSGNAMSKKILQSFLPTDSEADPANQSQNVPGIEELNDLPNKLFEITQWNMRNISAHVRRSALILFEYVTTISVDLEFMSSPAFEKMVEDVSPTVRRQLVSTMDKILGTKTSESICKSYVKVMLFLANDTDPKIVDDVMDSLRKYIFDNIDKYESTASERQLFPWRLLRLIIASGEDSLDLRKCIDKSINRKLMTARTLEYVETYLNSPYSLDAWILLSMVASNIKSKTPQFVYFKLQDNLCDFANEAPTKAFYQLDVVQKWFDDFPRQNQIDLFSKFTMLLESGKVSPLHVKRIYEMCYKYAQRTGELESWTIQLKTTCENYILKHCKSEMLSDSYDHQLINYLVIYSETIDESKQINRNITTFLFNFLQAELPKKINVDPNLTQKVNIIQIVLTRLAFRDDDILTKCVPMLATLLNRRGLADSICETAIKCLGDLCKKYTQLVESVISSVLLKTQSQSEKVRKCAIETLASLILEDYLKFRGSLLLYVLAATADQKTNIARLAHELIIKFANEKNAILIRSCLRECPFAFNDCKLVDNSEMFGSDLCLKSPLKSKLDDRRYIYRFLVHNLEVINCYTYFENFSTIKDRLSKKGFQKSPELVESIQDFLYICEHICKSKEIPKSKTADTGIEGDEDGETAGPSKGPEEAASSAPTTRKRNRQQTTLPEAMVVVEKAISRFPELSDTLAKLDASFKTSFDQICYAIGEHFGDSIKYFPNSFWDKYRKSKPTKRVARRKNDDGDDVSDDEANASKMSKAPRRNEQRGSVRPSDNSMNDTSSIYEANSTVVSSTPTQNNPIEEPRKSRKRTKSMATNDSGSDGDDVSLLKTPKSSKRTSVKKLMKSMVIGDSDSDTESLKQMQSTFKTPKSARNETKRTPRRSKNH
ncbi:uncharacterized protein LOC119085627 isoform X2 [Bradysia coprophila]|uniref:uncharacterized protein LOC119085627 isoform X2 n=1 Tax=Bradysia coprophila TaxID=38358 RepID=UPI00187D830A|nr:uncharacterized protein LOC119085627 isoform X2 [Bradysia coprophila]